MPDDIIKRASLTSGTGGDTVEGGNGQGGRPGIPSPALPEAVIDSHWWNTSRSAPQK